MQLVEYTEAEPSMRITVLIVLKMGVQFIEMGV